MSDTPFQAPSPAYLAELLPQYEVEFFIAQGGMGAVYKGRQRSLDRDVAIKVLPKELGANEEFRESFNTEAKAMAKLNHPNLLGVYDFGSVDGMPYIVMEYVEGGSLYEACYEQAVDPQQAVSIVKGICDGLANAHEHDIAHRDIKPANILLTEKVEPKVADFGLAQAVDSDKPGLVMGTPGYTAPEVFEDPDQAGKLADIYSVGVILHQLLTGIDPSGSMEPPSKPTGRLRLDSIWRKATNVVPTQRYATVDAMAKDLEKWLAAPKPQSAAGAAAPYSPRGAPVGVSSSSGGGGMGMKIFLILLLGIGVLVTFQVLNNSKGDIQNKNGNNTANSKNKVVVVDGNGGEGGVPGDNSDPSSSDSDGSVAENANTGGTEMPEEKDDQPTEVVWNGIEGSTGFDDETEEKPDDDPEETPDDEPEEVVELAPGDPELRQTAVGLILKARSKRDDELSENVRWFLFQLGIHKRDADLDDANAIELIENKTTETWVPEADADRVPLAVTNDYNKATEKEESIDSEYQSAIQQIRDAYVSRLEGAAKAAEDDELEKKLTAQAVRAEDLDVWVNLLAPAKDEPVKNQILGDSAFVGTWQFTQQDGGEERWIVFEDGDLEVDGKKLNVRWEILEDGTLEIRWMGNKNMARFPYVLKRIGGEWVGKTAFGKDITLNRGNP